MIVPNPVLWTAGEEPDADRMNARASDIINFLLDPPQAMAHATVPTSVPHNAWTKITLDVTDKDNDGIVDLSSSTFTIQTPGWYEVTLAVGFNQYGALTQDRQGFRNAALRLNGTSPTDRGDGGFRGRRDAIPDDSSARTTRGGASMCANFFNKGDRLELFGYQNSTATIDTTVGLDDAPMLQIRWVSN